MQVIVVSLLALVSASVSFADSYYVPDPGIRIVVNYSMLRDMMQKLNGTIYGGELYRGGPVCSSPDINLEFNDLQFKNGTWINWLNGNTGTELSFSVAPKFFTNDQGCLGLGLNGQCDLDACLNPWNEFGANALCKLWGIEVVNQFIEFPVPFEFPKQYVVLAPKIEEEKYEMNFEFGSFVDGNWIPDPPVFIPGIPPKIVKGKVISLQAVWRILGGSESLDPALKACGFGGDIGWQQARFNGDYLSLDLSAGYETAKLTDSTEGAWRELNSLNPILPGHIVGVSISPAFFTESRFKSGLLDKLLPLKIYGWFKEKEVIVEYEFFLTSAKGSLGKWKKNKKEKAVDSLLVRFTVEKPKLKLKDDVRSINSLSRNGIQVDMVLSLPYIDNKGNVKTELKKFRVGINSKIGDVTICFKPKDLEQNLTDLFRTFLTFKEQFVVGLPACIEAGGPDMKANRECPGGERQNHMSNDKPEKGKTYLLDSRFFTGQLTSSGRWDVSIPIQEIPPP